MVIRIIFLLLISGAAFAQQKDTLYTLPIAKARLLVQDAMRAHYLDSLNQEHQARWYIASKAYNALQIDCANLRYSFEKRIEALLSSNEILVNKNNDLQVDNSKSEKKVKFWKVTTIVGFGLGIYMGAKAAND